MVIGGMSWTPFVAAAAAIPLLNVGAATWLAPPVAAALTALGATVAGRRRRRTAEGHAGELAHLRRALVQRDEQLASTVHELRTPLASVITALELLHSGKATADADAAELTDIATLAARHLAFLVDDVLDEQALANGTLRLAIGAHEVAGLLAESLRTLSVQSARREVTLHMAPIDPQLVVTADPRRFQQVLFNLAGNALKFSRPGDAIAIRTVGFPDRVRIEVVDHGPGVPAPLRERLFERLDATDRDHRSADAPGHGLGLHVTAKIVHQMNGRVGLESATGGGSTFWFELPRPHATTPLAFVARPAATSR